MNGMIIDHGGEGKNALSFIVELNGTGRKIVINLKNGDSIPKVITIGKNSPPALAIYPSVDGQVLFCLMRDDSRRFFETATGRPLIPIKERNDRLIFVIGDGSRIYRPKFLT